MDLVKAYHQIPEDIPMAQKTAVTTPFGPFEFLRMPFGLQKAEKFFQCFLKTVFQGLDTGFIFVDDVLIASHDITTHLKEVEAFLDCLKPYGLR